MTDFVTIYAPGQELISMEKLTEITGLENISLKPADLGTIPPFILSWPGIKMELNHMDPLQIPAHLEEFSDYVRRIHGGTQGLAKRLLDYIGSMKLVHGVEVDPGFDEANICRKSLLGIVQYYNGLLFANHAIYGTNGEKIIGPEEAPQTFFTSPPTQNQLDREERSTKLLKQKKVPLYHGPIYVPDDDDVRMRSPQEMASRALVLWAVTFKAEQGEEAQDAAIEMIERMDLWPAVSPMEELFLSDPNTDEEEAMTMVWRLECVWVLLWALGYIDDLGWPAEVCDVKKMGDIIAPHELDRNFVDKASCRGKQEILDALDLTQRLHWAVRGCYVDGSGLPENLDWNSDSPHMEPDQCPATAVVSERHYVLNWMTRFMFAEWDDIDTPT